MIVYSSENNTSTIKLLICAKLAKKKVDVKHLKVTDPTVSCPKQLPVLVTPETKYFSSNAASLHLLPVDEAEDSLILDSLEWLEWEATCLVPYVANINGSKATAAEVVSKLPTLLAKLNKALEGKEYILGNLLLAVDICLWCTLYPIFYDSKLSKQFLANESSITNLKKWHERLANLQEVQEVLKEHPLTISELCQGLNSTSIVGGYSLPTLKSSTQSESATTSAGSSPEVKLEVAVTEEELLLATNGWENGHTKLCKPLPDEKVILPKEGYRNVLITSALPYVNNVPHLGNIIGCVLSADVFARYCRLCSYNTLYICGTDEYGTATETKAIEEKLTPRQICDKYFEIHNSVYRWFGIGFDYFGRTTTPEQTEITQSMFMTLYKNGFVETQTVEQLLCENCDRFLADRFVEGICPHPGCGYEDARGDQCDGCSKLVNATELLSPRCKLCSRTPVIRQSSHFFLDLPQLEPLLENWVASSEAGWSNSAVQITRSWLKTGLRSRCITRDLKWGVPVPLEGYQDKVFYVWFDAPIGYISITKKYTEHYEKWWKPNPKDNVTLYQFMAKDNVPFHCVVFPATLLGIGQKHVMVKHAMATEYLNYEDGKFSKSRGVGVFGTDAQDTGIPADVFRFYLLSIRPENQDSNFSWHDLATRNNSELLNNLGNFVNRAAMFCANSFGGVIPPMTLDAQDANTVALINREIKSYVDSMEVAKERDGLRHVLNISRLGNQYMQSQQPWVLLKGTDDSKARAGSVVGVSCNISCLLGVLLFPFMPTVSRTLLSQLNTELNAQITVSLFENPYFRNFLKSGHKIGKPSPLFNKIEQDRVEELKKKYAGKQASPPREIKVENLTAKELEVKVTEQGEKVRKLKSSGAEKAVWQPEVAILLALKKQLAEVPAQPQKETVKTVAQLEEEIAKQGEKVCQLKTSGAEKALWQPEVAILLALKKQLAEIPALPQKETAKTVAQLEEEVTKQGEKVRQLKASGAEKASVQPEVNILLSLKKQLADAQGGAGLSSNAPKVVQEPSPKQKKNKKAK